MTLRNMLNRKPTVETDPGSNDIFIITKRDALSRIYKLTYPRNTAAMNTASYIGSLSFTGVVSAVSSANGNELLIKTYSTLYYWKKDNNGPIEQLFRKLLLSLITGLSPREKLFA